MDVQDQSKHTIPSASASGHESHGVHLCHRCGWPFPNPHPSARHRRSHKKICGTIEGYTTLIDSEVVSDDEHHLDDDKDKTPSPKIEKKKSIGDIGGNEGRFSRSEEDLFSDAVTEFSDGGVVDRSASNKTLDRDLFLSFKDAENDGTNEELDAPIEIKKDDANVNFFEKVEKSGETERTILCESSEAKIELPDVQENVQEIRTSETDEVDVLAIVTKEPKNVEVKASEPSNMTPYDYNGEQEKPEKISDAFIGEKLESATKDGIDEEIKQEKFESDCEHVSEVVQESEIVHGEEGIKEEIKHEKFDSDHEHAPKDVKEPEVDQSVSDLTEKEDLGAPIKEQILEIVKEPDTVLTQKENLGAPKSEDGSTEQIQEVFKEPDTVLGAAESEKCLNKNIQEVVKELDSVLTEKEDLGSPKPENCSSEQIQDVAKDLGSVLTEKENLDAPKLEELSNEKTQEVIKEPNTGLIEDDLDAPKSEKHINEHTREVVEKPGCVLTEKENLDAPKLEEHSNEETHEVIKEPDTGLIEEEDLGSPKSEKDLNEHTREVVEKPGCVLTEENLDAPKLEEHSNEQTQEVIKEPDTSLIEEDLDAPKSEKHINEHTREVVEKTDTVLTEKEDLGAPNLEKSPNEHTLEVVEGPDSILTEKKELPAPNSEKNLDEHTHEVIQKLKVVADCSVETITLKETERYDKNDSEPIVEEGNGKLMTNQESGVGLSIDSSSRNSLGGNWGSVSALSVASADADTLHSIEKSKVNSAKTVAENEPSDVFEPPSFMTLVEHKGKDQKPALSDAPQAGWFPTLTHVSNESEGRKRNEEAIAKVTNWSTGKHSTPLKSLLGEAKSPNVKQLETVVQKDEAATEKVSLLSEAPAGHQDLVSSPPKLIEGGKKAKKVKGKGSWLPFVCCSSINAVN